MRVGNQNINDTKSEGARVSGWGEVEWEACGRWTVLELNGNVSHWRLEHH